VAEDTLRGSTVHTRYTLALTVLRHVGTGNAGLYNFYQPLWANVMLGEK